MAVDPTNLRDLILTFPLICHIAPSVNKCTEEHGLVCLPGVRWRATIHVKCLQLQVSNSARSQMMLRTVSDAIWHQSTHVKFSTSRAPNPFPAPTLCCDSSATEFMPHRSACSLFKPSLDVHGHAKRNPVDRRMRCQKKASRHTRERV